MASWKATVRRGRLVLDEPTELPEGTTIEFTIAEDGDELDEEERAALHDSLNRSWASARAGETKPAAEILRVLKTRE